MISESVPRIWQLPSLAVIESTAEALLTLFKYIHLIENSEVFAGSGEKKILLIDGIAAVEDLRVG